MSYVDDFYLVNMQNPNGWIMESMQFQDETDPEVIGIFEEMINDYCARLEPSVFTRFPRALVIHDNQMVLVDVGQLLRVEEVQ